MSSFGINRASSIYPAARNTTQSALPSSSLQHLSSPQRTHLLPKPSFPSSTMKLSLILASIAVFATTGSTAMASPLSHADMPRFLAEKSILREELDSWKQSDAGQYAKSHGFIIAPKTIAGVMSDDAILEDQLRRLFLTKLHIENAQRLNPDAVFSTDSPFTLMTDDEFAAYVAKSHRRGDNTTAFPGAATTTTTTTEKTDAALFAEDKDWMSSGCVAAVKDQGQCGSCWAFAAVAALESAHCIKGNALTTFSEQQLTSCDTESSGCEGGYPSFGLNYVQKEGKICSAAGYPYTSGQSGESGDCKSSSCSAVTVAIQQVAKVPESESGLLEAVTKTPVAVGVTAGNNTWKQYKSGVVATCESTQLDHAVLVVGYGGANSTSPFFKIKNSWGTSWGESGFIRLKRGVAGAGTCGVVGPKSVYPVL